MCSTEAKDQNRMMKLRARRKYLLISTADSMFCCFEGFVFGFFLSHTEINTNEDIKHIVGEI